MAFIKRSYLRSVRPTVNEDQVVRFSRKSLSTKTASAAVPIFLSHSHFDKDIIEKTAVLLRRINGDAYVDWQDTSLPKVANAETARALKNRISACSKFILIATVNSVVSRWVPWELGVADSYRGPNGIAILPIIEDDGTWKKNEYLGIYPRVETNVSGAWAIYQPGSNANGVLLRDWLTSS